MREVHHLIGLTLLLFAIAHPEPSPTFFELISGTNEEATSPNPRAVGRVMNTPNSSIHMSLKHIIRFPKMRNRPFFITTRLPRIA